MEFYVIFFIAIGLSVDSFAVAISNGLTVEDLNIGKHFIIALFLAFFQGIMPFFGWIMGESIEGYIRNFDHWVAFALLFFIGLKMIYEGIKHRDKERRQRLQIPVLVMQSLATSIDAFVVGLSFAFLKEHILLPMIVIGITTFVFSFIGVEIGKFVKSSIGKYAEVLGGMVLIAIGVKILIESFLK